MTSSTDKDVDMLSTALYLAVIAPDSAAEKAAMTVAFGIAASMSEEAMDRATKAAMTKIADTIADEAMLATVTNIADKR